MRVPGPRLAVLFSALALAALVDRASFCAEPESAEAHARRARELQLQLKQFNNLGTVLMIAAHPDDENTQLITYFARGRGYRMGYLSVTRGDGGQNLLGPEFGEFLGTIRTHELLAARRIDSGVQFFTRAIDFGYSKDVNEALNTWNRREMIGDVVRVIRTFRPDVIVTRFSTQHTPGQHGQHTGSAVLGVEAVKLAGDPQAYPEQLPALQPWQPKRILFNGGGGGGRGGPAAASSIRVDVSGIDSVTGETFGAISSRSRAMHKSQGIGNTGGGGGGGGGRGGGGPGGPQPQSFNLLDGEPAMSDPMDGVDVTWGRIPGGAEIGTLTDTLIATFNADDLTQNVTAVLAIREKVLMLQDATSNDPLVREKLASLNQILMGCLGLSIRTLTPRAEYTPGESLELRHEIIHRDKLPVPVRWLAVRYPAADPASAVSDGRPLDLGDGELTVRTPINPPALRQSASISQPYWLREDHVSGMFTVKDAKLIGTPVNPPAFPVLHRLQVGDHTIVWPDEPVALVKIGDQPEVARTLDVVPAVSLRFPTECRLFAPGESKSVSVEITARKAGTAGSLKLALPADWNVEPATQPFRLSAEAVPVSLTFNVTAPRQTGSVDIGVSAQVDGYPVPFVSQRIDVQYPHLPWLMFNPPARIKGVVVTLENRARNVGYIAGAGDSVAECIEQMGCTVIPLTGTDFTPEKLKNLDAVVIGVRALNVRDDLIPNLPALFAWVEGGGTVIVQYNRQDRIGNAKISPFATLRVSNDRVTDENAAPVFLVPDHAAVNIPNKITPADFEGWVQERGIYFPNEWSSEFVPVLAFSDPAERPLSGGLLVAKHGQGHFVYTGLVWFRQLPAGVPGAYRLFANLLSLGK